MLFDLQQRLVVCESRNRRITRTEPGGEIVVLTDRYEGHRYNSPNGKVSRVIGHEVERANGVLVSPDDRFLYVADNNNNNVGGARKLWRFGLEGDGAIDPASRKLIFDWQDGRGPDGFKLDQKGRLYVAAGLNKPHPPFESADKFKGGVYILSPEGKLLDFIDIPVDEVTNCAGNKLTASSGSEAVWAPVSRWRSPRRS